MAAGPHTLGRAVAADSLGNVFLGGKTTGNLDGVNAGDTDGFLTKYHSDGTLQWSRQFGDAWADDVYNVAADSLGNAYIAGRTGGNVGGTNAGNSDAYLIKYSGNGDQLWATQLGTSQEDYAHDVTVDGAGNILITGYTLGNISGEGNAGFKDAFVAKYDAAGNQQWITQLGTSADDYANGVATDASGNVYISGVTYGDLGGTRTGNFDAFVSKLDANGQMLWNRQLGAGYATNSYGLACDELGNVYMGGEAQGELEPHQGHGGAYLAKYDGDGNAQWTRQYGSFGYDYLRGVSADGQGGVFVSGGVSELVAAKFALDGEHLWTKHAPAAVLDFGHEVSADGSGNIYLAGYSEAPWFDANGGDHHAVLIKFTTVPEPSAVVLALALPATIGMARMRRLKMFCADILLRNHRA